MEIIDINKLLRNIVGSGYEVTLPYVKNPAIAEVPGGSATGPGSVNLITETLPPKTGVIFTDMLAHDLNAESPDFIVWSVNENGLPIEGFEKTLSRKETQALKGVVRPGTRLTLTVRNYSGTGGSYPQAEAHSVKGGLVGYYYAYKGIL
jgi:hypothetical protein